MAHIVVSCTLAICDGRGVRACSAGTAGDRSQKIEADEVDCEFHFGLLEEFQRYKREVICRSEKFVITKEDRRILEGVGEFILAREITVLSSLAWHMVGGKSILGG